MSIVLPLSPPVVQMGPREYLVYLKGTGTPEEVAADEAKIVAAPKMYDALLALLVDGPTADDLMLLFLMSGVTGEQQEKFRPTVERLRKAQAAAREVLAATVVPTPDQRRYLSLLHQFCTIRRYDFMQPGADMGVYDIDNKHVGAISAEGVEALEAWARRRRR